MIGTKRPWVVVAIALAAGLSIYFAAQGARYWQATGNISSVREDIGRLERVAGRQKAVTTDREARLTSKQIRLANLHRLFDYPTTDTLMSIVSETAGKTGLYLGSMTVDKVQIQPFETLQYHVQPIAVTINGPTANVREFLAALYDRTAIVVASDAKMSNLNDEPTTKLQLRFYLSPEPIPVEDKETSG